MKPIGLTILAREEKERRDKKTKEKEEKRMRWEVLGRRGEEGRAGEEREENGRGEGRKCTASEIAQSGNKG